MYFLTVSDDEVFKPFHLTSQKRRDTFYSISGKLRTCSPSARISLICQEVLGTNLKNEQQVVLSRIVVEVLMDHYKKFCGRRRAF